MTPPDNIVILSSPSRYAMAEEWYEIATRDHFWVQWRFQMLCRLLPKDYKWGDTFDIGCGNGLVSAQIKERFNLEISGCDLNLAALKQASAHRLPYYFYNVHEKNEDFRAKYDSILLFDVLEHIEDPTAFLRSVAFHQKVGGSLLINVPAFQTLYGDYDKSAGHVKRYARDLLQKELRAAGYQMERSTYWGMSLLPLLLLRKGLLSMCRSKNVIRYGFQPPHPLMNSAMKGLMRLEGLFGSAIPAGTSLLALARKVP